MSFSWFRSIARRLGPWTSRAQSARAGESRRARGKSSAARRTRFVANEALLRRLERLSLEAQRTLQGRPIGGDHPSQQQMPNTIFSDHRPYSAGDDYRYIDWNAYARQDQIVVKLGETEQSVDVHLLLDTSRSMAWGMPPKLVVAQELIATLGYLALAHSDRLRVTPFADQALPPFGPAQSKRRSVDLLHFVEQVRPAAQTSIAPVVKRYVQAYERGGLLVICSDLLADSSDGLDEALRGLAPPRWQVLVLHVLDRQELRPDLSGPLELEDTETNQRLALVLDSETLAAYRHEVTAWQEALAAACARRGATYARILTDWPLEQAVLPYLQKRRVVR